MRLGKTPSAFIFLLLDLDNFFAVEAGGLVRRQSDLVFNPVETVDILLFPVQVQFQQGREEGLEVDTDLGLDVFPPAPKGPRDRNLDSDRGQCHG